MPSDTAFATATQPFRPELLAHCYRMLGSIHDAEDLVQETYLRAWRAFDRFEGRSSVRRWLYAIATRVCLTDLESRGRRPLPSGLGAPETSHRIALAPREPSVPWLEPAPDRVLNDPAEVVTERAGVRLAFIAALQLLPSRQRAVLTLRDVLAFSAAEVADMLDTSAAAVDSGLRRARAQLEAARPAAEAVTEPDDRTLRTLLDSYVDAFARADAGALATLLRADVELEMPPIPTWFAGRAAVVGFLGTRVLHSPGCWHLSPARANGQPALVVHARGSDGGLRPYGVQVLSVDGDRVARVTAFNDPRLVPLFG